MPPLFGRKEGYLWGMRTIFQRIQRFGAFCGTLSLMATSIAQGPTLIDPIEVVEGTPSDTVMVAEWFVTNASENPMTLFVERNVLQVVETMNLPYVAGNDGAYERFCWAGTCYPYGASSSALSLAITLEPGDTTGINAFGAEDWMIADYYPNGVAGVTALEYCFKATQQGVPEVCQTVLFCAGRSGRRMCGFGRQRAQRWFRGFGAKPSCGLLRPFLPRPGGRTPFDFGLDRP